MKSRFKLISFLGIFLILAMIVSLVSPILNVAEAAQMTSVTWVSNDYITASTTATWTITFTATTLTDGDRIVLTFAEEDSSAVTTTAGNISAQGDIAFTTVGTITTSGGVVTIPITTVGAAVAPYVVTITGNTNRASAGSQALSLVTDDGSTDIDTGAAAMYAIGDNTVDITGTVDPTLSLVLSATSCDLGVLTSSTIETCSYSTTVTTNATSGYTGYLQSDAGLVSGSNEINAVADAAVTAAAEEYGVGTDTTDTVGATFIDYAATDTCANLDAGTTAVPTGGLNNSAQSYVTASAPVDGSSTGVTTLCHAAAITGTTPAGSYTQTVTVTVVGNF